MTERVYSVNQGIEFNLLSKDHQAYLLDNFPRMIEAFEEHLIQHPDSVLLHWVDCWRNGFSEIEKISDVKR